jgi:hypothetical protein
MSAKPSPLIDTRVIHGGEEIPNLMRKNEP